MRNNSDALLRLVVVKPTFFPIFGGHILHLLRLLPRMRALGVEPLVLTGAIPDRASREVVGGVAVRRVPVFDWRRNFLTISFGLMAVFWLVRHRQDYDVVHLLGAGWHLPMVLLVAKWLRKPVLIEMVLHGSDDPVTLSKRRFGRLWLSAWKSADRMVGLSTALVEACRTVGVPDCKIVRIPTAIDTREFQPPKDLSEKLRLRRELGLPEAGKIVVFLGGIKKRKGVDLLVEAWSSVVRAEPAAHLLLVGPRDYEIDADFLSELDAMIAARGLGNYLIFPGRVEDVVSYLKASDVYVLASSHEGLPNSVIEGMACGLPPVMSDMPGISRDIIASSSEGILVSERSAEGFAAAVRKVLTDDTLRETMSRAARNRVEANFDLEVRAESLATLIRGLVNRPS